MGIWEGLRMSILKDRPGQDKRTEKNFIDSAVADSPPPVEMISSILKKQVQEPQKKLIVEIAETMHSELKILAAQNGVTIKQLANEALSIYLKSLKNNR